MNTSPSGPQLPSAGAAQPAYAPGSYGSPAPPAVSSGYSDQTSTNPYQTTPYPGQPTGYSNSAPPTGSAVPNATPNYGAATSSVAPQNGPYNEAYGQPPANTTQPYPSTPSYQSPNTQGAYQPAGGPTGDATQAYGAGAADSRSNIVPPGANYGASADGSRNMPPATGAYNNDANDYQPSDSNSPAGYRTAENRYSNDRYSANATQPEQTAADQYAAANAAAGDPGRNDAGVPGTPSGDRYQPGNTGYNPGQTGYSPPGVPPYQMPGQPNVVSTSRRDPYYRPGTTSDYVSSGNSSMPSAAPVDRYNTPGAGAPTDLYAPPGGVSPGPAAQNGY